MKKLVLIGGIIVVVIILIVFWVNSAAKPGQYDDFAQCLSEKGVKMYGAYWCPHCLDQKELFGKSWKYIDYIECSLPNRAGQTQFCQETGIKAYPTWEFPDGERIEGKLSLEQLSQNSNCDL